MARDLDGSTGYVEVGDVPAIDITGTELSVHCWFYPDVLGATYQVIAKWNGGLQYLLYITGATPKATFTTHDNGLTGSSATSATTITTGRWWSLGGSLAAGIGTIIFVDGAADGSDATVPSMTDTAAALRLGSGSTGSDPVNGRLAEVAIWNAALSAAEFNALAKGASPLQIRPGALRGYWPLWGVASPEPDLSGNGNNGVVNGTAPKADHAPARSPFPQVEKVALVGPPRLDVPFLITTTGLFVPDLVGILEVPFLATSTTLNPPVIFPGQLPPVSPPSLPIAPPTGFTFATAALGCVVFIAATPGPAGNLITIAYVVAGTNTPLSMSVTGSAITINLATDSSGNPISTAGEVIALVNSDSETTALLAQEWDLLNASPEIIAWRAANPAEAALIDAYRAGGVEPAGIDDVSDALILVTTAWLISEMVTASLAPGCTMDDVLIALVPTPLDGGGSPGDPGGGGGGGPPGGGFGGTRFYQAPPWRWVVAGAENSFGEEQGVLTFLDHLMDDVSVGYVLDAPWWASGAVPSDDPEVNILANDPDVNEPFVTEGRRILLGFRREGGTPPWKIRFAGVLDQLEDTGRTEGARSVLTAHDVWQYMYHRPVCGPDGELPGPNGFTFSSTRASTIALDYIENSIANMGDMWLDTTSGTIENTLVLDSYYIQQGQSLGELLSNLCATGTIDIVFTPIYDPLVRPGIFWELNLVNEYGSQRPQAVFAWDKPSRNVTQISRLKDGSTRANNVQFYRDQGGPKVPLQTDSDSVDMYREYWSQQFFPGKNLEGAVESLAKAVLALRKDGETTVTISPAAERMPFLFTEFFLGDRVPVYASQVPVTVPNSGGTFRQQMFGYQRVYGIPIRITNGLERVERLLASANEGIVE